MITLKSKHAFENRLTKKNEEFQDFNNLLFRYFDLKEVVKKYKTFEINSIEFKKDRLTIRFKTYLWFEARYSFTYKIIIEQIQKNIINKFKKDDFIFGEKIVNNNVIYYVTIKNKEDKFYYENEIKIDLYLELYSKHLKE